jgi:hypothetical protein
MIQDFPVHDAVNIALGLQKAYQKHPKTNHLKVYENYTKT